ncbi:IS5 family transposase [Mesorhizobium sp. B3-2-1]|uniref:IS5 family transposase n=1 Tax=Mesorhizobium sp. B3-2-1 TaxID=2589891 RepID=UPI001FEF9BDB|nr:IS5 family transposase [Mesorhizobium sp. B3-2-1]
MDCDALRDDQWERIRGFVPGGTKGKRGPRTDNRKFLDALLWMARSGGRWRDLPERLGDYRSVKRRYYRWIEMGVLDEMLLVLAREADDRLDHCARSSARRRRAPVKRGADAQGLGRSRGGLSTKIHAAGDALGLPVRLIASPGQRNDIAFAHDLVDGFETGAAIADKGYDADHLLEKIAEIGADVVIPPKRNRKHQRPYDADLYKERNIIERFFNKLKQFRRVATRYDKLLANFMGFVKLAAIAIWLR